MWEDPIVNEIRKIRKDLEGKFDFDAKLIFHDIRMRQASLGSKLIDRREKKISHLIISRELTRIEQKSI
jgi:hypothetical protein